MSALLIRNKVVLLNKGLEIKLRFLRLRLMDRIIARLIDYKNNRQMQPLCVCVLKMPIPFYWSQTGLLRFRMLI